MLTHDREPRPGLVCVCRSDTAPGPAGAILVLRVIGEVDLLTAVVLRTALDTALHQRAHDVVLDLTGIRFCSVQGVRMMGDAALTWGTRDIGFALSGLSTHLDRIVTLVCPAEMTVRYRDATAAVAAARVDQTYRGVFSLSPTGYPLDDECDGAPRDR